MNTNYQRLRYACYTTNVSMSIVANLSPVLFLTFRNLYGISYSLMGLLILINFVTQLSIDLVFSFFSHKFNISKVVVITPALTVVGLLIYALWPFFLPQYTYAGLVIGTLIFAASNGFCEVLISPVIAAIPSKDPDREMSKLHSVYAWGVVGVIIFSTLFLQINGPSNWHLLPLILAVVPLLAFLLYLGTDIPKLETPEQITGAISMMTSKTLWLCVLMIFLGGASEVAMAQWSSSFMEQALGLSKVWGDIFGVALFSVMLGTGRTLYAKMGKNITKVLFFGVLGAFICYLIVAISDLPLIGLIACALTGLCVSMLWPGSLIVAAERYPKSGVFLYAMMAAGGDLGASISPQLMGIVTDIAIKHPTVMRLAQSLQVTPEQLAMKTAMLVGALFPLIAIPIYLYVHKTANNKRRS